MMIFRSNVRSWIYSIFLKAEIENRIYSRAVYLIYIAQQLISLDNTWLVFVYFLRDY